MLRVDVGGKSKAILFSDACHDATLPASNVRRWHGDYAGVAPAAIEAATPGLTALFMTGCGAGAEPESCAARVPNVQEHGEAVAKVVRDTDGRVRPLPSRGRPARGDGTRRPAPFCLRTLRLTNWERRFGLADPDVCASTAG